MNYKEFFLNKNIYSESYGVISYDIMKHARELFET